MGDIFKYKQAKCNLWYDIVSMVILKIVYFFAKITLRHIFANINPLSYTPPIIKHPVYIQVRTPKIFKVNLYQAHVITRSIKHMNYYRSILRNLHQPLAIHWTASCLIFHRKSIVWHKRLNLYAWTECQGWQDKSWTLQSRDKWSRFLHRIEEQYLGSKRHVSGNNKKRSNIYHLLRRSCIGKRKRVCSTRAYSSAHMVPEATGHQLFWHAPGTCSSRVGSDEWIVHSNVLWATSTTTWNSHRAYCSTRTGVIIGNNW